MFQRWVIVGILLAIGSVAYRISTAPAGPDDAWAGSGIGRDDGWRRTANGWERISFTRPVPTVEPAHPASAETQLPRWDIHPAAWGVLQLVIVATAFLVFPSRLPAGPARESQTLF